MAKNPPVKDSLAGSTINSDKFREDTIIRRLKGTKIIDEKRDIDHPKNRDKK
jgi:hypothetical protein